MEGSATFSRAFIVVLRVCLYACGGLAAALVSAVLQAGWPAWPMAALAGFWAAQGQFHGW